MIIFSPGPANISERVRKALTKPDICHRDTEFTAILKNVRAGLLDVAGVGSGYEAVLYGGSGTSAIESLIASFGGYAKKILIVSNGVYGERASSIARIYGIDFEEARSEWGSLPDMKLIESRLAGDGFGAVYIVHHETTTGLLNPLKEVAAVAGRYDKLVLTDAVSSIAGEELDIAGWGIDAVTGSANKCIRAVPGVSFVIVSKRLLPTLKACRGRTFCTDLVTHYEAEMRGQTPFTPPVQAFYALEEALEELKAEGVAKRIAHYKETAAQLRSGLKRLGIKFYISEENMSNTMTVIYTPEGHSYLELHGKFKKEGFVIYASQGKLNEKTFRLGTVGIISPDDIERFLEVFKAIL